VNEQLQPTLTTSSDSAAGTWQTAEQRAIRSLASLVEDAAVQLETSARDEQCGGLIFECNAALEACLEHLRDVGDGDNRVATAKTARDDLKRLSRLLKVVDTADVPFVMRQIRRVLGRFDASGGNLLETHETRAEPRR